MWLERRWRAREDTEEEREPHPPGVSADCKEAAALRRASHRRPAHVPGVELVNGSEDLGCGRGTLEVRQPAPQVVLGIGRGAPDVPKPQALLV